MELRASTPDRFQVTSRPSGCAGPLIAFFGLGGVVLSLWGLWSLGNAAALSAFGVRDEGKLAKKHQGWVSSDIFGHVVFDPVQKTVEITGQSKFGGPPQHPRIGTHIPVVYWAGKPETARWNSFGVRYFPNLIILGVGLIFTLGSWAYWSRGVGRRKSKPSGSTKTLKTVQTPG